MANVRKIEANTAFVTITSKLRVAAYCRVSTDMWDPETQCAKVESLSDLKECPGCGIISEQRQGQLINSLNQVTAFIEKESTLSGVIKKLKKLKKYTSRNQESTIQVGYLSILKEDLLELIRALEELEQIVSYFFTDFENGADNFRRFYNERYKE